MWFVLFFTSCACKAYVSHVLVDVRFCILLLHCPDAPWGFPPVLGNTDNQTFHKGIARIALVRYVARMGSNSIL